MDEFGMVGSRLWGATNVALSYTKVVDPRSSDLLGRLSMIIFGHHAQLPPIKDHRAFSMAAKDELQALGRCVYFSFNKAVVLRKQHRLDTDERRLAKFQKNLMDGKATLDDYEFSAQQSIENKENFLDRPGVTYVVARHEEKNKIDREMLIRASRESNTPIPRTRRRRPESQKGRQAFH